MKITSAQFLMGATRAVDYPKIPLPQVVFAGRSNVGKSSLINCLVERKALAKTSSTPGKTREINFFLVNNAVVFVDLPGYGYARVSKEMRERWRPMIEEYFTSSQKIRIVVIIVDIRRGPEQEETALYEWLSTYKLPVLFVATKGDKEKKSTIGGRLRDISRRLGIPEGDIVLFSAKTRLGRDVLWSRIREACGA